MTSDLGSDIENTRPRCPPERYIDIPESSLENKRLKHHKLIGATLPVLESANFLQCSTVDNNTSFSSCKVSESFTSPVLSLSQPTKLSLSQPSSFAIISEKLSPTKPLDRVNMHLIPTAIEKSSPIASRISSGSSQDTFLKGEFSFMKKIFVLSSRKQIIYYF